MDTDFYVKYFIKSDLFFIMKINMYRKQEFLSEFQTLK